MRRQNAERCQRSGYVWMSEEAENVCDVASEKMNGIIQLFVPPDPGGKLN